MSGSNTDSEQREKLLRESLMAFGESYRRWFYAIDDNEAIDRAVQRFAIRTAGQSTASQPTPPEAVIEAVKARIETLQGNVERNPVGLQPSWWQYELDDLQQFLAGNVPETPQ